MKELAIEDFKRAYISRYTEYDNGEEVSQTADPNDLTGRMASMVRSAGITYQSLGVSEATAPMIASSQYKLRNKTDEQAKLFPDLQKEIDQRRNASQAPVKDQKGKAYKEEICEIVKTLNLCPSEQYPKTMQGNPSSFL